MREPEHAAPSLRDRFNQTAARITATLGSPDVLVMALLLVVLWAVSGPFFQFSETWQLLINTTTTIITFLMVFVIQASQNRDSKAIHLKLDEVIRAVGGARNALIGEELRGEAEIEEREQEFLQLAETATIEALDEEHRSSAKHPADADDEHAAAARRASRSPKVRAAAHRAATRDAATRSTSRKRTAARGHGQR